MAIAKVAHLAVIDIGMRIHLRKQMVYLKQLGYEVHFVGPRGRLIADGPTEDGIPVKIVSYTSSALTPIRDARALVELVRYFRAERFDIVHTHGLKPGLLGRLAARIARVPIVVHTVHGLFFYEGMNPFERLVWAQVERLGMKLGDYALSQNREDLAVAVAMGLCHRARIGYLGNGVDLGVFSPDAIDSEAVAELRRQCGVAAGEKVVSIAGRFLVEKGYLEFFRAARRVRELRRDVHFWAVGAEQPGRAGSLARDHQAVAEASEFVRFLGMRWDMPHVLAASDVFVLPSHGREGIPRVLMEAAAMKRPIVTTDVRGCREVVQHGVTGLLVPPRDPDELALAILRLISDQDEAARLGARAGEFARRHCDENEYCRRIAYCYESLLRKELPSGLEWPGPGQRGADAEARLRDCA